MSTDSFVCTLDNRRMTVSTLAEDRDSVIALIEKLIAMPSRFSWLKLMAQSPWDYLRGAAASLENGEEEETLATKLGAGPGRERPDALRFGTAIHHLILGSAQRVVVYGPAERDGYTTTKPKPKPKRGRGVAALLDPPPKEVAALLDAFDEGKRVTRSGAAWEAFRAEHEAQGRTILLPREMDQARLMADAILRSKLACELLFDGTQVEERIEWRGSGRLISSKPDARKPRVRVVDLKSCPDSHPNRFIPHLYKMLYHAQLATYAGAAEEHDGGGSVEAWIVAVDRKRPPRVYRIAEEGLELGRQCLTRWVEDLRTCEHDRHFAFDGAHIAYPPSFMMGASEFAVPDFLIEEK